jgi:hypothetical protein
MLKNVELSKLLAIMLVCNGFQKMLPRLGYITDAS